MISGAALLLLAPAFAATNAVVPAYPAAAVLEAFKDGCSDLASLATARTTAQRHGWQPIAGDAPSALKEVIARGKAAAMRDPDVKLLAGSAFQRTVGDRKLYLALSGVRFGKTESRGCRLYDFEAPSPLDQSVLANWVGRKPNSMESPLAGVTRSAWTPGIAPRHHDFEAVHVAAGAQLPFEVRLAGLVLAAQTLESEQP